MDMEEKLASVAISDDCRGILEALRMPRPGSFGEDWSEVERRRGERYLSVFLKGLVFGVNAGRGGVQVDFPTVYLGNGISDGEVVVADDVAVCRKGAVVPERWVRGLAEFNPDDEVIARRSSLRDEYSEYCLLTRLEIAASGGVEEGAHWAHFSSGRFIWPEKQQKGLSPADYSRQPHEVAARRVVDDFLRSILGKAFF